MVTNVKRVRSALVVAGSTNAPIDADGGDGCQ